MYARGYYAAHVVAAAVRAALRRGADLPVIFDRMLGLLRLMYDENPSWGPLSIATPSDLAPLRIYIPARVPEPPREPARETPEPALPHGEPALPHG